LQLTAIKFFAKKLTIRAVRQLTVSRITKTVILLCKLKNLTLCR
jgi:hypothetical protein